MPPTPYTPSRVMVIVAHPDDIEFGCAGTVARWRRDGAELCYVHCTSGEMGGAELALTPAQVATMREAEQRAAAAVLGVSDLVFLREPDGLLENSLALRKKLVREIRRFRPEVVITEDPTLYWGGGQRLNHPDHRAAGGAALDAIFPAAGQPHLFADLADEGLRAHKVRRVYVRDYSAGTTFVDISETLESQLAALRHHVSQLGSEDPGPSLRAWAAATGERAGMAYAEAYRLLPLLSDEEWAARLDP